MALTRPRAAQIYDIDYKQATRVVTVSNITLAGGAPSQVDGVNLSLKDRVLVTGQSDGAQNGIYYVTTLGSGSNGTWTRSLDTDATGELLSGTIVMVTEGVIYADTQWKLTTNDPITIGVTALTFVQNYSANSISSGNSNVVVLTNANVLLSSQGTANVVDVFGTGITITGTESVTGNATVGNLLTAGQISSTGNITTAGYVLGNVFYANGITASKIYSGNSEVNVVSSGGNVNVSVGGTSNVAVFSTAGEYITGVLSVTGNTDSGNLRTAGQLSATGNITTDGYVLGNVFYANGITASKIYSGNSEVNVVSAGGNVNVSIGGTSNVVVFASDGEYITGLLSITGNTTSGNLLSSGLISSTGNLTSGNILTAGLISATGNITGGNILGNGYNLSGINAFSTIAVTGQNSITANSIATTLTFAAGNNIIITNNNTTKTLTIEYSSGGGGGSIFATGGDMGTVDQAVTSSEDLGPVTDPVNISYDLGQLGVEGVVSNSDIIKYQITGDRLANNITISTTGNISGANISFTSGVTDVRGWWYGSGNSVSVNSQETAPTDVILNTVGTTGSYMFVVGTTNKTIYQYNLSTPWQANSASYSGNSANVAAEDTSPQAIQLNAVNTVLYMLGGTNKTVYQYTVSYSNVATLSYTTKSFSVNSQETAPKGLAFSTSEDVMYIVGSTSAAIYQYTLGTPGDVSTAAYNSPGSFSVSAQDTDPTGLQFSTDGYICYVIGKANDYVYQYSLSTAWDITTASYTGYKFSVFAQEGAATGLFVNATTRMAYIVGAYTGTARVWQYNTGSGTVGNSNSLYLGGQIQVVGNIQTQGYLFGDGGYMSNITAATIANTTSNVSAGTAGGNITLAIAGTSNVVVWASTGEYITGLMSVTGNVQGGNLRTAGLASVTGNITGGNILTAGLASVTGNITGGNILTAGIVSATGNGTFGNVSATTITETSSIQFKENIRPLANPLLAISQLAGVTYDRRDGSSKDEVGLIAEEVYQVIPELVSLDEHGHPYGIKYTKLTAYLIECIKDLQQQIKDLKKGQ